MYHFQKNIGDYRSATMHLSLLEHGAYNQMLDWYYLDETPLPLDNRTLFRRLSAKSETEQQAVLDVLKEMFEETPAGWVHKRIEREISQYKAKADQARNAGKLGGRPLKKGIGSLNNRDGFQKEPDAKPTANREPLTINQEPIKEYSPALRVPSAEAADDSKPLAAKDLIAEGVDPQVAADWLKVRKAKKAPLTKTAWDGVKREGELVGMTPAQTVKHAAECGWQGFKASWLEPKTQGLKGAKHSNFETQNYHESL